MFKWIKRIVVLIAILFFSLVYTYYQLQSKLKKFDDQQIFITGPLQLRFLTQGKIIHRWINPCLQFSGSEIEFLVNNFKINIPESELCADLWNQQRWHVTSKTLVPWDAYQWAPLILNLNSEKSTIETIQTIQLSFYLPGNEISFLKDVIIKPTYQSGWPTKWEVESKSGIINEGSTRYTFERGLKLELQWAQQELKNYYNVILQIKDFYWLKPISYLNLVKGEWHFQVETTKSFLELIQEMNDYTSLPSVQLRHELFQVEEVYYQNYQVPVSLSLDRLRSVSILELQ